MRFNFGFALATEVRLSGKSIPSPRRHKASGAGTGVEQAGGGARTIGLTVRVNFIKARVIPPQSLKLPSFNFLCRKTSRLSVFAVKIPG